MEYLTSTSFEQYRINKVIKETKHSVIYSATNHEDNEVYAIKFYKKDSRSDKSISNEIYIQNIISHPNVIPTIIVYNVQSPIFSYAKVMPAAKGGDLFDLLANYECLSENITSRIIRNVLKALEFLHNMNIIHRNVKLENILLMDQNIETTNAALTGFSNAIIFEPGKKLNEFDIGTFEYSAPEIHNKVECFII